VVALAPGRSPCGGGDARDAALAAVALLPAAVHLDGIFAFLVAHRHPALLPGLGELFVEGVQFGLLAVVYVEGAVAGARDRSAWPAPGSGGRADAFSGFKIE